MSTATVENNLSRALELVGGSIDPEIARLTLRWKHVF